VHQIVFEGTTTFAKGSRESGFLMKLTGSDVTMTGAPGHTINCNGPLYWDGKGETGSQKPKFFRLQNVKRSKISNLHVVNTPMHGFSINGCQNLILNSINIDNSAGNPSGGVLRGVNTDGFGVSSSQDITISNATVHNQDDCLALNSGTGITFTGAKCIGSHGISIGSIKGASTVANVHVSNSVISRSDNGIRIKTYNSATGSVTNVTYERITLDNVKKGIVVVQNYVNHGTSATPGNSVISGFKLRNISGRATSVNVEVICGSKCTDWSWENVRVEGPSSKKCVNPPSAARSQYCK
jgi:galacturan 1,4-alpha-galacturonidase